MRLSLKTLLFAAVLVAAILLPACGPTEAEIAATVDAKVAAAFATIAAFPTVTPQPTPSPFPTPIPQPSPLPTATPLTLPTPVPTPTPATPAPTATPYRTPTPFRFPGTWPVVRVSSFSGFGNGVLISPTEVLTAYHVIAAPHNAGRRIEIEWPASPTQPAQFRSALVKGFDDEADVALLAIAPLTLKGMDFAVIPSAGGSLCATVKEAVQDGDVVVLETTGNHQAEPFVYRVFGRRVMAHEDREFMTDIPGIEGLSGSPLYTADSRQLAGITTKKSTGLSNINPIIAVDACHVAALLPSLRAGEKR